MYARIQCHLSTVDVGAVTNDGRLYSWGSNEKGQLGSTTKNVGYHSNRNNSDQLTPLEIPGVTASDVSCGDEHTLVQSKTGGLYGCGSNVYGQLGTDVSSPALFKFTPIQSISQVSNFRCGSYHSVIGVTGRQVLLQHTIQGNLRGLQAALAKYSHDLNAIRDSEHNSLLHIAVIHRHPAVITLLLQHSIDANLTSINQSLY